MAWSIAQRIVKVQSPVIPIVGQMIASHPGTISLGQGVVHYPPPDSVRQAVIDAIEQDTASRGNTLDRYGDVCGIPRLVESIRRKLLEENRIDIASSATIVCTAGSNMGFLNSILAIADVGDEIILLGPYYFNHQMAVEMTGCRAVIVPTDTNYQLDLEAIEQAITLRTKAVVSISPNNPTGAVYPRADLIALNGLCKSRGIYHISDEAYEYFVYHDTDDQDAGHFSPASMPDALEHTISLFSFSKAYGMAGWRMGFMVVPNHLVSSIKKVQDTNLICPPIISQIAAHAALAHGSSWCKQRLSKLNEVRETILREFAELSDRCTIPVPKGAFYCLLQLRTSAVDMKLVEDLIRDYAVAVLPGSTFGVHDGCSIRISYGALEANTVVEGIGRLKQGLGKLL